MKKYTLYLADQFGGFNKLEPLQVKVQSGILHIGKRLSVNLHEIASCELVSLDGKKREMIELVMCSPELNHGQPTTVHLIHKHFLSSFTRNTRMPAFVAELQPLIGTYTLEQLAENAANAASLGANVQESGKLQAN